jgi:histidinol-phosphate phosphatase family protein
MRNGVPSAVREVPLTRNDVRRTLRLPRRNPLVVHVGELQARKGQVTTLEALALLRGSSANPARDSGVPFVAFVGTGSDEALLRDRCHALGVQEHVLWLGFRTNAEPYLAAADVCVLPSRAEGAPWTILEAMAQGTPVVASAVSGVPEIVEHGVNGLLIEPDDAPALASAVRRLLEDEDLARRLASTALQHVNTHWSAGAMLDDLECLVFSELLRRRHAADRSTGAARVASRAALLVDRDETLVHNVPYNGDPGAVRLVPGAGRALRWVRDAGIPVVVVTNQSGIAQGLHDADDVRAVHARMRELLSSAGADADALYFCPHHPDHGPPCDCRKPLPGMLLRALRELDLSADESLMVGDAQRDLDAAHAAGVPAVGLAAFGGEHDLDSGERVYTQWTAIVRDFLCARWAGVRFGASAAEGRAPCRSPATLDGSLESPTRSG